MLNSPLNSLSHSITPFLEYVAVTRRVVSFCWQEKEQVSSNSEKFIKMCQFLNTFLKHFMETNMVIPLCTIVNKLIYVIKNKTGGWEA